MLEKASTYSNQELWHYRTISEPFEELSTGRQSVGFICDPYWFIVEPCCMIINVYGKIKETDTVLDCVVYMCILRCYSIA